MFLNELAARVSNYNDCGLPDLEDKSWLWDMRLWSENQRKSIKESIVVLMSAAGEGTGSEDVSPKSIPELLEVFAVGTECRKSWKERTKLRPKPSELGPISGMDFISNDSRAKFTICKNSGCDVFDVENGGISDDEDEESIDEPQRRKPVDPDYKKVWSLMEAANIVDGECRFAGTRLLTLRANVQLNELTAPQKSSLNKLARKGCVFYKEMPNKG